MFFTYLSGLVFDLIIILFLKINPNIIATIFDWNDKIRISSLRQYFKKRIIVIKVFNNLDLIFWLYLTLLLILLSFYSYYKLLRERDVYFS